MARLHLRVGPSPLADAGHPLQPSPLEPEPPDPSALLDLGTGDDPGGHLGAHADDAGAEPVLPAATGRRRHDFTISFLVARCRPGGLRIPSYGRRLLRAEASPAFRAGRG